MEIVRQLKELGVAGVSHVNGSFLEHLQGVQLLLESWGNREALCHAGIFHSIYGSNGFQQSTISVSERERLAGIIGSEAEQIVYTFCAADRPYFREGLARESNPEYRDRLTGEKRRLEPQLLRDFCELLIADQLDIFAGRNHDESTREDDERVRSLLQSLEPNVSEGARAAFREAFRDVIVQAQ
jgi:hypothetical protein